MDDTFVIQEIEHRNQFMERINSMYHIQFTTEKTRPDGSMPFLDIVVPSEANRSLSTTKYRKQIPTDQYLHWDSYQNLYARYSVFITFTHRARTLCFDQQLLQNEMEHMGAMQRCTYPNWALNRLKLKTTTNTARTLKHQQQQQSKQHLYDSVLHQRA